MYNKDELLEQLEAALVVRGSLRKQRDQLAEEIRRLSIEIEDRTAEIDSIYRSLQCKKEGQE